MQPPGGAWDLAADLTRARWFHMMIDGEMGALRPILETMPTRTRRGLAGARARLRRGAARARRPCRAPSPICTAPRQGEALVPADRRVEFAASRAAIGLYEGRLRGDPVAALHAARALLDRDAVLESDALVAGVRSFVLGQLGIVELWTGDLDAATAHLERAHAGALESDSDWTALAALAHLSAARAFRGEIVRALRHADDAIALAERRGWARSEPAGAAYCVQAAVAIQRGHNEDAVRLVASTAAALHDTRDRPLRAAHALNRALLLSDAGESEAALGVLQVARDDVGGWPLLGPIDGQLLAQEALLRAAVGERAAGRALLERAESEAATSVAVANAIARLRLLEGDPDAARDALAPHLAPGADAADPGDAALGPRGGVAAGRAGPRRARRARRRSALAGALARSGRAGRPAAAHPRARHPGRTPAAPPRAPRHGAPGDRRRDARQRSSTGEPSDRVRSPCC